MNIGRVRPLLRTIHNSFIRGSVELTFVNLTVRSRDQRVEIEELPRLKRDVEGVELAAQPDGFYQVFVTPEFYRPKSAFVNVTSGSRPVDLELEFFIRPELASPKFHRFDTLEADPEWAPLMKVMKKSQIGRGEYEAMPDEHRGCLFNLHAKMRKQEVSGGNSVFSFVDSIRRIQQDRIFCRVQPALLERTRQFEKGFRSASAALHQLEGFEAVASFKTHEKVGNLQLTFFKNQQGEFVVDADLDDHQGLQHAFDVIEHKLTDGKTHPFDIHQVLVKFHGIDPGYRLGAPPKPREES